MRRFFRFVILGFYSPSLVGLNIEPMPAPTLAGRWRQWRALRRLRPTMEGGERRVIEVDTDTWGGDLVWTWLADDRAPFGRVIEIADDGTATVEIQ